MLIERLLLDLSELWHWNRRCCVAYPKNFEILICRTKHNVDGEILQVLVSRVGETNSIYERIRNLRSTSEYLDRQIRELLAQEENGTLNVETELFSFK